MRIETNSRASFSIWLTWLAARSTTRFTRLKCSLNARFSSVFRIWVASSRLPACTAGMYVWSRMSKKAWADAWDSSSRARFRLDSTSSPVQKRRRSS